MDLVLLEPLAGRQIDDDRSALLLGVQHGRIVRRHVERGDVPVSHPLPPDSGGGRNSILSSRMVIAIDGPAGAGKSTVARAVARALGFTYLDTGAMYRSAALAASRGRTDAGALQIAFAGDRAVREALVARQRALIAGGDYVAEGRDIATVVAPDAEVKVYLTADPAERARRRAAELGLEDHEAVAADLLARDERDSGHGRTTLEPAPGAVPL